MKKVLLIFCALLLVFCVSVSADDTLVTLVTAEGATLKIAENVLPADAVVTIEKPVGGKPVIMAETVLADVTLQRDVYEIYALSNGTYAQPQNAVPATFTIPESFDLSKIVVYYVSEYGESELLTSTVDNATRTVTTELPRFGTYAVSEKAPPKVIDIPGVKKPKSNWWIWPVVGAGVVLVAAALVIVIRKRK